MKLIFAYSVFPFNNITNQKSVLTQIKFRKYSFILSCTNMDYTYIYVACTFK